MTGRTYSVERIARVVAWVVLVLGLVQTLASRTGSDGGIRRDAVFRVDERNADSATAVARAVALLVAQRTDGDASEWPALSVSMTVVPSAGVGAVLGAVRGAGVSFRWSDSTGVEALAAGASSLPAPRSSILVAADAALRDRSDSFALVSRDAAGMLDSISSNALPLRLRATRVQAPLRVDLMRRGKVIASATASVAAPPEVRRVLLVGRVGWESKFVSAALEESGWNVEGTFALSPTARVRIGAPAMLDTSRYSAVVVLDSGVASARDLRRFLSQGGGVLVAGDGLRDPQWSTLAPARTVDDRPAVAGALLTDQPRRGLSAFHLRADSTSIIVEREGTQPVVVVARRGPGRIMVNGFRSTWRWRMEGRDASIDDHRRWWNDMVTAVASATDTGRIQAGSYWPGEAAPIADLVARLGEPAHDASASRTTSQRLSVPLWVLFAIASVALLIEWTLRRLRGAP